MSPPLDLRLMTANDLAFADSLRAMAGWNQTLDDWRDLLALEPTGCFVAEWNGTSAGTATTTCYEKRVAWIGMALVHPECRRRGIGRRCFSIASRIWNNAELSASNSTRDPVRKALYEQLGFRDEWPLTMGSRSPGPLAFIRGPPHDYRESSDAELARELDAPRVRSRAPENPGTAGTNGFSGTRSTNVGGGGGRGHGLRHVTGRFAGNLFGASRGRFSRGWHLADPGAARLRAGQADLLGHSRSQHARG